MHFLARVLRLRRNTHNLGYQSNQPYTGLTGSSTQVEIGCTDLQLIGGTVVDCQALTWPCIVTIILTKTSSSVRAFKPFLRSFVLAGE